MVFLFLFFFSLSEALSGTCLLGNLLDFVFFKRLVETVDILCLCMKLAAPVNGLI